MKTVFSECQLTRRKVITFETYMEEGEILKDRIWYQRIPES